MTLPPSFKPSPWDSAVFGVPAYEMADLSPDALAAATRVPGHYTVRLDPLASKQALHEHGFYYCDTLIEPHCKLEHFAPFEDRAVSISTEVALEALLAICHGAFVHGRFHRDFGLPEAQADARYVNWLVQLHRDDKVYGLLYREELAGFIAAEGNRLILHAVATSLRGRGLAKFLWSPVCQALFDQGCDELTSSVSAANLAVVNLYGSLGFRFRNSVDLYHRLTR
jgi:ribosomal protein S18 acetylase RimI-like enzyme